MTDIFGNKSEEQQRKELLAKNIKVDLRNLEISDFKHVLNSPQGRRFMWRLMSIAGVFRNPFVIDNDRATSFNCGSKSVGDLILAEIMEIAPTSFEKMMREEKSRKEIEKNGN